MTQRKLETETRGKTVGETYRPNRMGTNSLHEEIKITKKRCSRCGMIFLPPKENANQDFCSPCLEMRPVRIL